MSKCLFFKLLRAIEISKRYQNAYKFIFFNLIESHEINISR